MNAVVLVLALINFRLYPYEKKTAEAGAVAQIHLYFLFHKAKYCLNVLWHTKATVDTTVELNRDRTEWFMESSVDEWKYQCLLKEYIR